MLGRVKNRYIFMIACSLGGNAFYELPSPDLQEKCVLLAREALAPGGWLFVDNDDYKGDWGKGPFGEERTVFEGTGADGTHGRYSSVQLRFDECAAVLYTKRIWLSRTPDGQERRREWLTAKHPVTAAEVRGWLAKHGFEIVAMFGDKDGHPYTSESRRALFWAELRG